jgi:hypothetical protein
LDSWVLDWGCRRFKSNPGRTHKSYTADPCEYDSDPHY